MKTWGNDRELLDVQGSGKLFLGERHHGEVPNFIDGLGEGGTEEAAGQGTACEPEANAGADTAVE
jgi:hypothetical protein